MTKKNEKFVVTAYCPRELVSEQTFQVLWTLLGQAPFTAQRYDQVERAKQIYTPESHQSGYALYRDLLILVRGAKALLLMQHAHPFDKVGVWTVWIEGRAVESTRSRAAWIDWLSEFFAKMPLFFGMGCFESEFKAKHDVGIRIGDSYQTEQRGWRPPDFDKALPGIYWANYYGPQLTAALGSKIRECHELVVRELGGGKLLATLKDTPKPEDLKGRLALEREVAAQIGAEYFFDVAEPDASKRQVPELLQAIDAAAS